jgi:hypothetical protein
MGFWQEDSVLYDPVSQEHDCGFLVYRLARANFSVDDCLDHLWPRGYQEWNVGRLDW